MIFKKHNSNLNILQGTATEKTGTTTIYQRSHTHTYNKWKQNTNSPRRQSDNPSPKTSLYHSPRKSTTCGKNTEICPTQNQKRFHLQHGKILKKKAQNMELARTSEGAHHKMSTKPTHHFPPHSPSSRIRTLEHHPTQMAHGQSFSKPETLPLPHGM